MRQPPGPITLASDNRQPPPGRSRCWQLSTAPGGQLGTYIDSPESTMRLATVYYLSQAWSPRTNRQFQPDDAPPCTASRGRHARVARRDRPGRGLPAITRRVLTVLNGTS